MKVDTRKRLCRNISPVGPLRIQSYFQYGIIMIHSFTMHQPKSAALESEDSSAVIPTISLVALFCGDAEAISSGIRRHQDASSKKQFPLFPLDGSGSVVPSFRLHPVFDAVSSRVPPGNATSCFVGLGDKGWDNFKNSFRRGSVPHHHRAHVPQPNHQCLRADLGARYGRIRGHAHARGREAHEGMQGCEGRR